MKLFFILFLIFFNTFLYAGSFSSNSTNLGKVKAYDITDTSTATITFDHNGTDVNITNITFSDTTLANFTDTTTALQVPQTTTFTSADFSLDAGSCNTTTDKELNATNPSCDVNLIFNPADASKYGEFNQTLTFELTLADGSTTNISTNLTGIGMREPVWNTAKASANVEVKTGTRNISLKIRNYNGSTEYGSGTPNDIYNAPLEVNSTTFIPAYTQSVSGSDTSGGQVEFKYISSTCTNFPNFVIEGKDACETVFTYEILDFTSPIGQHKVTGNFNTNIPSELTKSESLNLYFLNQVQSSPFATVLESPSLTNYSVIRIAELLETPKIVEDPSTLCKIYRLTNDTDVDTQDINKTTENTAGGVWSFEDMDGIDGNSLTARDTKRIKACFNIEKATSVGYTYVGELVYSYNPTITLQFPGLLVAPIPLSDYTKWFIFFGFLSIALIFIYKKRQSIIK